MSYANDFIGGKDRGLKFNQFAAQEFSLNYTRHEKMAADNPDLFFLYNIFYSGLAGNCKAKGEEIEFTIYDIVDWIDELYDNRKDEVIHKVVGVFKASRVWEDMVQAVKQKAGDKKKESAKPIKKKSSSTGKTT